MGRFTQQVFERGWWACTCGSAAGRPAGGSRALPPQQLAPTCGQPCSPTACTHLSLSSAQYATVTAVPPVMPAITPALDASWRRAIVLVCSYRRSYGVLPASGRRSQQRWEPNAGWQLHLARRANKVQA